jgi:hypothetical protein
MGFNSAFKVLMVHFNGMLFCEPRNLDIKIHENRFTGGQDMDEKVLCSTSKMPLIIALFKRNLLTV